MSQVVLGVPVATCSAMRATDSSILIELSALATAATMWVGAALLVGRPAWV